MIIYDKDDVKQATLEYFGGDEKATDIWIKKYALVNKEGSLLEKTPQEMHERLSREFARIEERYENPLNEVEIFALFDRFRYVIPQGSPMSAIGNPYQVQSLSNCFVIPSTYDSYGGIMFTDEQQIQIMKRRGGVGHDISNIRPSGTYTANAARTSDGIDAFMERFSRSCREVAQGGRRGALMLSISCKHPDVEKFITIKDELTRCKKCGNGERLMVTGANVSVRLTDDFMRAVENDANFELQWPIDSNEPTVRKTIRARDLWDTIVTKAWKSAEPGVFFWDTVRKMSPADAYPQYFSISTNPCGELALPPFESCRLMALNLKSFVVSSFTPRVKFDFKLFDSIVMKAQRLMDDLVDLEIEAIERIILKINSDPEPDDIKSREQALWGAIKERAIDGRRTGLGITALGDTLASLNIRYGSDESVEMTEKIYKCLALAAHRSSCTLAKERGKFPAHSHELERDHPFISKLNAADDSARKLYEKFGRRNIALTTTAPCGTISELTRTTSGIEPVPFLEYMRRRKVDPKDGSRVDFVDASGDSWQQYNVRHWGLDEWSLITGETDVKKSPYHGATCNDINWMKSVEIQAAAQRWLEHSCSKTHNLPRGVSKEIVSELYMRSWKLGCKGATIYVDGSRDGVIIGKEQKSSEFVQHDAPKRDDELLCNIHHAKIDNEAWTILVGLVDKKPYEIFGGLSSAIELPRKYKSGKITKHQRKTSRSIYDLIIGTDDDQIKIKDIVNIFANPTHSAFTRTISLALRHGTPVQFVCEQLMKDDEESDMFSFSRVMSRVLKTYVPDGTTRNGALCPECNVQDSLIYSEGCVICSCCGFSKCQ